MGKGAKTTNPPDGLDERDPAWHREQLTIFTRYKMEIGEPSPHLAMVGHMSEGKPAAERAWMIGCYAAVYCLPTAQILWTEWPMARVMENPEALRVWLHQHKAGIVMRRERRCVYNMDKLQKCLVGYAEWTRREMPLLPGHSHYQADEYYDIVWKSVMGIPYIGRYIAIRVIEGLRRFCGIPALLYDVRSMGGWSPKKALVYLFPEDQALLLTDSKEGNALANQRTFELLREMQRELPAINSYILAAMLCEYKGAFENRHQYPGWTIDQEPLLCDKVAAYWGEMPSIDLQEVWRARAALFPAAVLGEVGSKWHGTRWDLASTLRDHGYNWSDLRYEYVSTRDAQSWASPIARP